MARVPTEFVGEYRGRSASGEFVNDEGDTVAYTEGLKFEVDLPDGDVELVQVRLNKLDEVAAFDAAKLVKGERVRIHGVCSFGSFGGSLRILKAEKEPAGGKVA